jgi:hypothetical protein
MTWGETLGGVIPEHKVGQRRARRSRQFDRRSRMPRCLPLGIFTWERLTVTAVSTDDRALSNQCCRCERVGAELRDFGDRLFWHRLSRHLYVLGWISYGCAHRRHAVESSRWCEQRAVRRSRSSSLPLLPTIEALTGGVYAAATSPDFSPARAPGDLGSTLTMTAPSKSLV